MVKVNRIKAKMVELGKNAEDMARAIGNVAPSSFYNRLNKPETITVREAAIIGRTLELSDEDMMDIFFSD